MTRAQREMIATAVPRFQTVSDERGRTLELPADFLDIAAGKALVDAVEPEWTEAS